METLKLYCLDSISLSCSYACIKPASFGFIPASLIRKIEQKQPGYCLAASSKGRSFLGIPFRRFIDVEDAKRYSEL